MSTPSDTLLSAKGLDRRFGADNILHEVNVELRCGQSLAVVSPSGTGKSTLLSILGLLLHKSAGILELYGQDVDTLSAVELARIRRLNIGFVFQHTQLIGSLRALDNAAIGANLLHRSDADLLEERFGSRRPDFKARAAELLCGFGLEDRLYHFPHQLSVGQKRRVAVARALLLTPPLVIADEPTNDLDAASADVVIGALFNVCDRGGALVFATHDRELAARADVVLELAASAASSADGPPEPAARAHKGAATASAPATGKAS
jgi:putative ABC transport system ATP-binding protein